MFFLVVHRISAPWPADERRSGRWAIALLTVLTTSIQPATTLAVAPAAVVYLLVSGRGRERWARETVAWFAVPGAVVCLLQVWFLSSKTSEYEQAEWLWRPFWHWHHFGLDRVPMWLLLVVIPASAWAVGRRYFRDPAVALSLIALVIALPPFLLLQQTTVAKVPDADLSIPPIMAMLLLFVSSMRLVLLEYQQLFAAGGARRRLPAWFFPVSTLFAVMLVAGVVDLLAAMTILPPP
jgi:hypothetical protein